MQSAAQPFVTIVFDFETSGFDSNNVPAQLAYQKIDAYGELIETHSTFLKGPTKLDPWVLKNAPHITIARCAKGVTLEAALDRMLGYHNPKYLCLVAHHSSFDIGLIRKHGTARAQAIIDSCRIFAPCQHNQAVQHTFEAVRLSARGWPNSRRAEC